MKDDRLKYLHENERAALDQFLARLRRHYPDQVLHMLLFGSKARGDFEPESDVDLLLVVRSDDWRFHREISHLAFEPMLEHDTILSTHTIGQGLYTRMRRRRTPFYQAVQKEGVELWTRQPGKISATISD